MQKPYPVKIIGIHHNYFHSDPYRGNSLPAHDNILDHRIRKTSELLHQNEVAIMFPGLETHLPKLVTAYTLPDMHPFSYEIQSTDIPLVQFNLDSILSEALPIPVDNSGFRIVFAREAEFEFISKSNVSCRRAVSSKIFPEFEYDHITRNFRPEMALTDGFTFLQYNRGALTKEDEEKFEKSLPKLHLQK